MNNTPNLTSNSPNKVPQDINMANMIDILEVERKRISFDIHDKIQHKLRLIRDMADGNLKCQIEEVIGELQTICYNLMPKSLEEFSLSEYLPVFIVTLQKSCAFMIDYKSNVSSALPKKIEVELFAILNEAVTNIIKHAEAPMVFIRFWEYNAGFALSIQDMGRGFNSEQPINTIGLLSMQERAKMIGATFNIDSEIGYGTKITLKLPQEMVQNSKNDSDNIIQNELSPPSETNIITPSSSEKQIAPNLIYIVDNQAEVVWGLKEIILKAFPTKEIHTFLSPEKALEKLNNTVLPEIIISDITMPTMTGFKFIEQAKKISPDTKYIIYTINDMPIYLAKAIRDLNINAFALKEDRWEDDMHPVVKAIVNILQGITYYSENANLTVKRLRELTRPYSYEESSIRKYVFLLFSKIVSDEEELSNIANSINEKGAKTFKQALQNRVEEIMNSDDCPEKYGKLKTKILKAQNTAIRARKLPTKGSFKEVNNNFYLKIINNINEENLVIDDYHSKWLLLTKIAKEIFDEEENTPIEQYNLQ